MQLIQPQHQTQKNRSSLSDSLKINNNNGFNQEVHFKDLKSIKMSNNKCTISNNNSNIRFQESLKHFNIIINPFIHNLTKCNLQIYKSLIDLCHILTKTSSEWMKWLIHLMFKTVIPKLLQKPIDYLIKESKLLFQIIVRNHKDYHRRQQSHIIQSKTIWLKN